MPDRKLMFPLDEKKEQAYNCTCNMFSIVWIVGSCADLACKHNLMLSSLLRLPFTTIPAWFWKYRLCLWDKGVLAGRHKLFHQIWKTTKTYSLFLNDWHGNLRRQTYMSRLLLARLFSQIVAIIWKLLHFSPHRAVCYCKKKKLKNAFQP